MINGKDHPVEWAMLSYDLEEVIEHLRDLSALVNKNTELTEEEFEVYIGHVYTHLNRMWNSRNHVGELTDEQHDAFIAFPQDINFYG